MDIYSSRIMELAIDINHVGRLCAQTTNPIGQATKVSKICGSQVSVELRLDPAHEKIIDFAIDPKACALGQASAAILSHHIIGATISEVLCARDALFAMLKKNGAPPEGRFWEIRYLEPVTEYLPRHASVMLAWDAAVQAIEQILKQ